jgi:hypothetical protein
MLPFTYLFQGYYDFSIVGSGDWISLASWLGQPEKPIPANSTWKESFIDTIHDYAERAKELKKSVGYVEGLLCHYFHGNKDDRKYYERSTILNGFNPNTDIKKDSNGMLDCSHLRPDDS